MTKPLLVDRLTVAYDRAVVLRDVSVAVQPGQVLAVTGPSGAGKTTLLWAMAGLVAPMSGSVTIGGLPVRGPEQALVAHVVLVPQDNGLAPILTARENIQVALLGRGVAAAEARRRAAESLDLLGLTDQADQLVEELSGGQQQRTAVARAIALRASVLLADEVTSELDATNRQRVIELLRAEAGRGGTVIFATHDPEAAAVCDRELRLLDGCGELSRG